MPKIAHLTSVHPRFDTRIFYKMCKSLASNNFDVNLVVADGKGDETIDGVKIFDVGRSRGRLDRIINAPQRIFFKANQLDSDIYHLHDPELLPVGLRLRKLGRKVIFDSHEDVPQDLLYKPYLNKATRWILSNAFATFQSHACSQIHGIVAATPFIRDKLISINPNSVAISNFPLTQELESETLWSDKHPEVCYVGGIDRSRGILEMCRAMELVNSKVRLNLVGTINKHKLENNLKKSNGWQSINTFGFLNRAGVRKVLDRSIAGLVTLHPIHTYIHSQPIKMFEYMSAGIPVIASNFPLWRKIIEENNCGLVVDPLNPKAIAEAIDKLVSNPNLARKMGENGRRAVEEKYNWPIEEKTLLSFYERILVGEQ